MALPAKQGGRILRAAVPALLRGAGRAAGHRAELAQEGNFHFQPAAIAELLLHSRGRWPTSEPGLSNWESGGDGPYSASASVPPASWLASLDLPQRLRLTGTSPLDTFSSIRNSRASQHAYGVSTRTALCKESQASSSEAGRADYVKQAEGRQEEAQESSRKEEEVSSLDSQHEHSEAGSGPQAAKAESDNSDVAVEVSDNTDRGFWGSINDLYSACKMPLYLWFHRNHIEKTFDLDDFLEGSCQAFRVVNELYGKGDFESMSPLVTPRFFQAYQEAAAHVNSKLATNGWHMALTVELVDKARLVDAEIVYSPQNATAKYGLHELTVPPLTDYHDDLFLVLSVRIYAEIRWVEFSDVGRMVSNNLHKGWHTIKLSRQLPKISTWNKPFAELESPWYLVDLK